MPNNKKPIIVNNPNDPRLRAYNDSLFIKTNFHTYPRPKGYNESLKRVKQDPSSDYFPAPQQPYIYKKPIVDTRDKTIIEPLTSKTAKLSLPEQDNISVVKQLPVKRTGGKFARYPNMKNKIEKFNDSFVSGAKSVKQYRGDENLPEAKNGMKKCGCKHTRSKYKYGTGAIPIPEGSAIVTANDGMNKAAVDAHLNGDTERLENIIKKMPNDSKPSKYKYKKVDGADALGLLQNVTAPSQATKMGAQYPWFKPFTSSNTEKGRISSTGQSTLLDPNDVFNQYNNIGALEKKAGRKFNDMRDLQGYIYDNMSDEQRTGMWKKFGPTLKSSEMTRENFMDNLGGARTAYGLGTVDKTNKIVPEKQPDKTQTVDDIPEETPNNRNILGNIPPLAQIAARTQNIMAGVEKVPKNYLSLGRYKYTSDLPQTLQDLSTAEQGGRETARDIAAGDAGRYLSQAGSLSASRMKAADAARARNTQGALATANANVDLGNTEAQTNLGLKNQYAEKEAMARAAYDQQKVSLGQNIDSAIEASREMAGQRAMDQQRLQTLKDVGMNYEFKNVNGVMQLIPKTTTNTAAVSTQGPLASGYGKKNGTKKVKTYKRR